MNHLLLLPGLMCDATFWRPLLDDGRLTAAPTVIDYGDADSLSLMAERALALAPNRFALAGHSMGGRVALEMMRVAPERVQRLMLMDTGYRPLAAGAAGDSERAGRLALVDLARREGVAAMCKAWTQGMVHPDRLNDQQLLDAIGRMFQRKSAELFARQQQALLRRADAASALSGLSIPLLLLCGRQDNWASVAQHEAMRQLAPNAELTVIEDAGHMVLMERPAATIRALLEFLQ